MATTAKQNGTAKSKVNGTTEVKATVKPKPGNELSDRIQRSKQLSGLVAKREKVQETQNHLREFKFGSDENCVLSIKDSSGKEFKTVNSRVIEFSTTALDGLLTEKLTEIDAAIIAFEV